jgi:hypothetical protein
MNDKPKVTIETRGGIITKYEGVKVKKRKKKERIIGKAKHLKDDIYEITYSLQKDGSSRNKIIIKIY